MMVFLTVVRYKSLVETMLVSLVARSSAFCWKVLTVAPVQHMGEVLMDLQ